MRGRVCRCCRWWRVEGRGWGAVVRGEMRVRNGFWAAVLWLLGVTAASAGCQIIANVQDVVPYPADGGTGAGTTTTTGTTTAPGFTFAIKDTSVNVPNGGLNYVTVE